MITIEIQHLQPALDEAYLRCPNTNQAIEYEMMNGWIKGSDRCPACRSDLVKKVECWRYEP